MEVSFWEYLQDPDTPAGMMDLVYALFVLYGLIRGAFRGLAFELAGLLGTAAVFLGGWYFYPPVSRFLIEYTRMDNDQAARAVAYVLMVLLFLISWKVITLLVRKLLNLTFPEQIQGLGGAVLGGLKCAVTLCVILLAVRLVGHGFLDKHLIQDSWLGRTTQEVIPDKLHEWFPGRFPEDAFDPPASREEEAPHGNGDA